MNSISTSATYPSLRDRVVIVTGGASGIGESIVEAFALQGAKVCLFDIQDDAAASLVHRLELSTAVPAYYQFDLTDVTALQSAVKSIVERFGTMDMLVAAVRRTVALVW